MMIFIFLLLVPQTSRSAISSLGVVPLSSSRMLGQGLGSSGLKRPFGGEDVLEDVKGAGSKGKMYSDSDGEDEERLPIILKNYPYIPVAYNAAVGKFLDPNRLFVALQLPTGATNPTARITDGGMLLVISYDWPLVMFSVTQLMSHCPPEIRNNVYHPLMSGTQAAVDKLIEETGEGRNTPRGKIEVELPFAVDGAEDRLNAWPERVDTPLGGCFMVKVEMLKLGTTNDVDVRVDLDAFLAVQQGARAADAPQQQQQQQN